jgi:OOP family OmpA-OmpF porin
MKSLTHISTVLVLLLSGAAAAEQPTQFYIGGGVGSASVDMDNASDELEDVGIAASSFENNDSDVSVKVFGGYQINEYFAVEVGYGKFGAYGFDADISGSMDYMGTQVNTDGQMNAEIDFSSLFAQLVLQFPVSDQIKLFTKLGLAKWEADYDVFSDITVSIPSLNMSEQVTETESMTEDGSDTIISFGATYDLGEFSLYGEYETAAFEEEDVTSFNAGVIFHF